MWVIGIPMLHLGTSLPIRYTILSGLLVVAGVMVGGRMRGVARRHLTVRTVSLRNRITDGPTSGHYRLRTLILLRYEQDVSSRVE